MLEAYKQLSIEDIKLDSQLMKLVKSGFECRNDCFFLRSLIPVDTNTTINDFPDKTGYECFINSLHIDNYVEENCLAQGILFVNEVFRSWNSLNEKKILLAILSSQDGFSLNVKLHVKRLNEDWVCDDLNKYKVPVMVVDSKEILKKHRISNKTAR